MSPHTVYAERGNILPMTAIIASPRSPLYLLPAAMEIDMRTTRNRDSLTFPSLSSVSAILFAAGEEESFFASCLVHNILNVQVTNPMTGRHIGLEIKADATSCLNCCALQTHP